MSSATISRGERGPGPSNMTMLIVFLFVVAAFLVLAVRTEVQQRQISRNAARIERLQYDQCQVRNEASARQIALIDSAITAEKRKPVPDAKRIKDLERFRPAVENCGPAPK